VSVTVNEVSAVVADQVGHTKVAAEHPIVEDLGAESADVINIIAAIEEKYGILIEDSEIPDLLTVNDLFQLVCERVA
jgi:acyl carrier protein